MAKTVTEEEKTRYRKGCLTGLMVALAVIVLSAGINQVTGFRTDVKKSADFMNVYQTECPKEFTEYSVIFHISNNNFFTVKTNLSKTGEGVSKAVKIKDQVLEIIREENIKASGIRIVGKEGKTLYDSTTRGDN